MLLRVRLTKNYLQLLAGNVVIVALSDKSQNCLTGVFGLARLYKKSIAPMPLSDLLMTPLRALSAAFEWQQINRS